MTLTLYDDWHFQDPFGLDEDDHAETGTSIATAAFANALQIWAMCQDGEASVAAAALAFNCTPDVIRHAVNFHAWMFLEGDAADPQKQIIEHEGE